MVKDPASEKMIVAKRSAACSRLNTPVLQKRLVQICSYCQQIKKDEGAWIHFDQYPFDRSTEKLTHGVCPDCFEAEIEKINNSRKFHLSAGKW